MLGHSSHDSTSFGHGGAVQIGIPEWQTWAKAASQIGIETFVPVGRTDVALFVCFPRQLGVRRESGRTTFFYANLRSRLADVRR